MAKLFESIFTDGDVSVGKFFIILLVAILIGVILALVSKHKGESTKSFYISTSILPACVAMVIMLINGSIGAGVAVAGAFSLVRFRSAQGNAREICILFIDMTLGLALGMGYIGYALVFAVVVFVALFVFDNIRLFEKKENDERRRLKVVIPESVNYIEVFEDLFLKYTKEYKLIKVKSCNMGAMFALSYEITLNDINEEKAFIDEIRCRNGNLEVLMERETYEEKDF